MYYGTSIKHAIHQEPELRNLVIKAIADMSNYFGFYWDEENASWEYWATDIADATASNCYYTQNELMSLIGNDDDFDDGAYERMQQRREQRYLENDANFA